MITYNLKTGQNSVLRGLIAEEFARYILNQRMPLLILRPKTVLDLLNDLLIKGSLVDFLWKYQKSMDFFAIGPILSEDSLQFSTEQLLHKFFYSKGDITRYLLNNQQSQMLKGFIIEVKSRTTANPREVFEFSFSPNQESMLSQCGEDFDIILCGVTFTENWNLSIAFYDRNLKILPRDYFSID
ncbi:MAG: hypothetical protein ACFFAU_00710 [Candidatus Hodarchaeota archaeon]